MPNPASAAPRSVVYDVLNIRSMTDLKTSLKVNVSKMEHNNLEYEKLNGNQAGNEWQLGAIGAVAPGLL